MTLDLESGALRPRRRSSFARYGGGYLFWVSAEATLMATRFDLDRLEAIGESVPLAAGMLALPGATLVCCTGDQDAGALQDAGAEVMSFAGSEGRVDASAVLAELAARGVNDVLVEAGPRLAGYLLEKDLVDELVIYQAPHIMGSETMGLVSTPSWSSLADRRALNIKDVRRVGADMRITATPSD